MKIAIVTITTYTNYGNRFQLIGLTKYLQNKGYEVDNLIPFSLTSKKKKKKNNLRTEKKKTFIEFSRKYINEIRLDVNQVNYKELINKYDYFIIGSDQIWHPLLLKKIPHPFTFLNFVPDDKKIAISASFGMSQIADRYFIRYVEGLKDFKNISLREPEGNNIIKNLCLENYNNPVLIDPSMLLNKKQYAKIGEQIERPKNYILTYFLGNISSDIRMKIIELSKKYNYQIININNKRNKKYFIASPAQFIYLMNNSNCVFTDSFHGTIFSMIFRKPFVNVDLKLNRPSVQSRIDNLLSKFNFMNRKYKNLNTLKEIMTIDYSHFDQILKEEKNKFNEFLEGVINGKEEENTNNS